MLTVYNPLTGEWERLDDVTRPFPVIARDSRLVIVNDTTPFTPSLSSSSTTSQTDIFGNTDGTRANIGISRGSTSADVIIPDPWRIRRFIVVCNRAATGSTSVNIVFTLWGRLLAPDGTPTGWRGITSANETSQYTYALRLALPGTLSGVNGMDQYRITVRRDIDSSPTPDLSLVRVFVEY
jgi:hypothetical protein